MPCPEEKIEEYLTPISDAEKDLRIRAFHKHMHPDQLFGCACCGVRVVKYDDDNWLSEVKISELSCLKLNNQQLQAYSGDRTFAYRNLVTVPSQTATDGENEVYYLHRRYMTLAYTAASEDIRNIRDNGSISAH